MTWSEKQDYCRLGTNDLRTCETCVGKGSDCFWCGGKKKECLPFDWYYPDCNIKHVKYNVCWVSTSAAAVVIAIAAGIIAVILIACFCYCCCKKWNEQRMTAEREMEMRQSERSDQRKAELDAYRMKYNIPAKTDGKMSHFRFPLFLHLSSDVRQLKKPVLCLANCLLSPLLSPLHETMTSVSLLSFSALFVLFAGSEAVFTQSAGVKGVLMCGDKPLANTKVKLYDDDTGPDLDDLLAEGTTDSLGQFLLSGHTSEVMTIDPKINIYHDCDDGISPCQRKVTFNIPKSFVSSGENPKTYFNIGTINMQIKRSILDNVALDDPKAECRNGGIFAGGICHCIKGQTGPNCEHFECVHGLSVGFRFDPESLLFNEPCICEKGWKGELCDFQPAEKCGNKGSWKKDHCECVGNYFGSECQYTSRCVEGFSRNGRCICNDGFEGDCCDKIVCVYGTPDFKNRTLSCHCPEKYTGRRCEKCKRQGPLLEPFPDCGLDPSRKRHIEKATMLRAKVKAEIRNRLRIIALCVAALSLVAIVVCLGRVMHKKSRDARELRFKENTAERHRLLTNQVRLQKFEETVAQESSQLQEAERLEERGRRKSEPAVLKVTVKKPEKIKLKTRGPVRRKDTK
ncbi:unnamed protein product [Caenorhabditis sp. 36 PRJEB53466]|nr:unnamed protein product [Caenorhabditis sp. 36 PRJEB53466]